ncbi:MAG: hypothetical protein F6K26_10335 [Moorea sp. SIO2I5]|nr:hypothetical protein [Moorena sp. SIO2I5]
MGILPVTIFGRAVPILAVRYGTGCPNTGYEAENQGSPVPILAVRYGTACPNTGYEAENER